MEDLRFKKFQQATADRDYKNARRVVYRLCDPLRFFYERKIMKVAQAYVNTSKIVLDLGCGCGITTIFLGSRSKEVLGVDFSERSLLMAKELCGRRNLRHKISFVLGDAEQLPFFSEHFDTVFFKDLLHHVPNPLAVTNEMARVCKAQGDVIGVEANGLNPEMFLVALFFRNERRMLTSTPSRTLHLFAVSDAYRDLSVKNEAVFFPFHTIGRVFTLVIPRRIFSHFLEIVGRLENILGRSPLSLISLFFVISARKKASTISQGFSLIKKL